MFCSLTLMRFSRFVLVGWMPSSLLGFGVSKIFSLFVHLVSKLMKVQSTRQHHCVKKEKNMCSQIKCLFNSKN